MNAVGSVNIHMSAELPLSVKRLDTGSVCVDIGEDVNLFIHDLREVQNLRKALDQAELAFVGQKAPGQ